MARFRTESGRSRDVFRGRFKSRHGTGDSQPRARESKCSEHLVRIVCACEQGESL